MLIWAAIALVQAVALPGLLLTRLLRLDGESRIQTAAFSFGLSLLANHALVIGLVLAGVFTRPVLCGVIVFELLALAALARARPSRAADPVSAGLRPLLEAPASGIAPFWPAVAAFATLAWLALRLPDAFTHTFRLWDTVQSWNRWALDWHEGLVPAWMMAYPQLLPTNWALVYTIQGNTLAFVAHGMMSLFPLAIAALLFDLGLRRRDPAYLLAVPIATGLLVRLLGESVASGHADVPLAFFALLALHVPFAAEPWSAGPRDRGRLAACALAAGAAALTKQPGLFVIAVLPLFLWRALAPRPTGERVRLALLTTAAAGALAAPWYAYVVHRIANGRDWNNTADLAAALDQVGGPAAALPFLVGPLGWPVLALVLALIAISLLRREARWLVAGIVVPFLALWAWKASYGTRNAALAIPFAGVAAAMGIQEILLRLPEAGRRWLLRGALLAALVLGAGWLARVDMEPIAAHAEAEWLATGDAGFRRALLERQRETPFEGRILSDDRFLLSHPELRELFFLDRDAPTDAFWPFYADGETFARIVADPANDIRYVLITRTPYAPIQRYLSEALEQRRIELVLRGKRGRLFRVLAAEPTR